MLLNATTNLMIADLCALFHFTSHGSLENVLMEDHSLFGPKCDWICKNHSKSHIWYLEQYEFGILWFPCA